MLLRLHGCQHCRLTAWAKASSERTRRGATGGRGGVICDALASRFAIYDVPYLNRRALSRGQRTSEAGSPAELKNSFNRPVAALLADQIMPMIWTFATESSLRKYDALHAR